MLLRPKQQKELVEGLTALAESVNQAPHDFCGEQRAWHLPRLKKAFTVLAKMHPLEMIEAVHLAKEP